MKAKETFTKSNDGFRLGLGLGQSETMNVPQLAKGELFIKMTDAKTGEVLYDEHKQNVITLDAGILAAILFRDPASRSNGIFMLAVGTGATGALLSPDAPDPRQRKLNAEIARKAFSSTTFRNGSGIAVAYETNIVDFTCSYGEAEAVGPLNEMGLISPLSSNPSVLNLSPNSFPVRDTTLALSDFDILVNYLTFACVTKPSTAVLTITWRITF